MRKTHDEGVEGDACGQAGLLPAASSTSAPAAESTTLLVTEPLEDPSCVQRGGVVGGVGRIEALAGGLADPHRAAGDDVEVLHAPAQAVGLVGQHRADGGGAVGTQRGQLVVRVLVEDRAVGPDGVAQPAHEEVRPRPTAPG